MKWCLSSRQEHSYLLKADEIKVAYRDRNFIYDIIEKYPEATVILAFATDTEPNWKEIETFNILLKEKLIACIRTLEDAKNCAEKKIKFYFGFPITSFQELNNMKALGVSYVRLGGPLFFSMEKVKKFGIPVRAIPNIASEWPWPGDNGVTGTWIRPEDVELYSNYVDAMEFENCNLQQERGIFRIYAEQQAWPGDMTMIISNLHTDALNRLVHPSLAETRLNCGQRCQETGRCHYCERMLMMSTEKFVRQAAATLDLQS